jgi:ATP-binding cassette subfamily B protein
VKNLRRDLRAKLDRLPLAYFDGRTHGEILSRATNDVDTLSGTLQQSLTQIVTAVISIAGAFTMMLVISPALTLVALGTLPFSILITMQVAKRSRRHFKDQQATLGELNGKVEEAFSGHIVVKAFGREKETVHAFNETNRRLYESSMKAQFISGLIMPLMHLVNNLGYALVCVIGGILAARRTMEIGDIQAFIQYLRQFTQPIVQTANLANVIQSSLAAAERVFELLDEKEEIPDVFGEKMPPPRGEVHFEHVGFSYKPGTPLIEDMNFHVEPGQLVAIVGPTGAGKTTLVNLMLRFYEIQEGLISFDRRDIRTLAKPELRSLFGMVLQDTWLFNGTIRDNIAYGREGADFDAVVEAAKTAHADHFIRTLPDGYETLLNEEASNISQGQKQLITIARAVLADPPVLILDEATSSVDTRTEQYIQKAMTTLMSRRTSFVIAHRLSTIRDADLILVMNEGRLVEQGTHDSLVARGGFYAELYESRN